MATNVEVLILSWLGPKGKLGFALLGLAHTTELSRPQSTQIVVTYVNMIRTQSTLCAAD